MIGAVVLWGFGSIPGFRSEDIDEERKGWYGRESMVTEVFRAESEGWKMGVLSMRLGPSYQWRCGVGRL